MSHHNDDYDYIVKVVLYLQNVHGVVLSISCRDFDILYRWWEKSIPMEIIQKSISNVVKRRKSRNKKITGFSSFVYEVRKNFKQFFELQVGKGGEKVNSVEKDPVEFFFQHFPDDLIPLRPQFDLVYDGLRRKDELPLEALYQKLLAFFKDDEDLAVKSKLFVRALSPELRTEKMESKYRINYLINRYRIPDFSIERS